MINGNGKVNITQVTTIAVTKTLFKIDLSSRSAKRKKKKKKKKEERVKEQTSVRLLVALKQE